MAGGGLWTSPPLVDTEAEGGGAAAQGHAVWAAWLRDPC